MVEGGGVCTPVRPIFFSSPGSLVHDSIVNGFPRRHDVTREKDLSSKWNSVQEFDFRGKMDLKVVQNGVLVDVKRESRNERDATSAMVLSSPAIEIVSSGDV